MGVPSRGINTYSPDRGPRAEQETDILFFVANPLLRTLYAEGEERREQERSDDIRIKVCCVSATQTVVQTPSPSPPEKPKAAPSEGATKGAAALVVVVCHLLAARGFPFQRLPVLPVCPLYTSPKPSCQLPGVARQGVVAGKLVLFPVACGSRLELSRPKAYFWSVHQGCVSHKSASAGCASAWIRSCKRENGPYRLAQALGLVPPPFVDRPAALLTTALGRPVLPSPPACSRIFLPHI